MGPSLIDQIIDLTGLPKESVTKEFLSLLEKKGISTQNLTLEHVRIVLSEYLQDVLLKAKEEFK